MKANRKPPVVIVGAGTAGLAAAGRLLKHRLGATRIEPLVPPVLHDYRPLRTRVGGGASRREASARRKRGVRETLQQPRYANAFSLGDASSLPTSKTAAANRAQAPVLVKNLLEEMRGEEPKAIYDGYSSCPRAAGCGRLLLAEFDYPMKPKAAFPFNPAWERFSMYLRRRFALPVIYGSASIQGTQWPVPVIENLY